MAPAAPSTPFGLDPAQVLVRELGTRCEPVVHLATGTTVAHEVLAARRVAEGAYRPALAAELAGLERDGTIAPVTDAMLERAWRLSRAVGGLLHVNVSAVDLADRHLPRRLAAAWPERDRGRLVVEVTEHRPVVASTTLRTNLAWLREQGVTVALDDYGDGHADDRAVALLEPAIVKVSAVGLGLGGDWSAPACRSLAAIAAHLDGFGVTTVVEGIDHPDQVASAVACGYDLAQGHLYRYRETRAQP